MPSAALDGGAGNRTIIKLNASTHDCRHLTEHAFNATIARQRARTSREPAGLMHINWPDFVFEFHDGEEIGPKMFARIAKHTGLRPEDLLGTGAQQCVRAVV